VSIREAAVRGGLAFPPEVDTKARRDRAMLDERRTLLILGWLVGSTVTFVFALSAMALP
jgi:hypothetical protein